MSNEQEKKEDAYMQRFILAITDGLLRLENLSSRNIPLNISFFPQLYPHVKQQDVHEALTLLASTLPEVLRSYFAYKRELLTDDWEPNMLLPPVYYVDILLVKFLLSLLCQMDAYIRGFLELNAPDVIKVITEAPRELLEMFSKGSEAKKVKGVRKVKKVKAENGKEGREQCP